MAGSNSILQKVQQAARDYVRAAAFGWIDSDSIQSGISRGPAGDDMDADQSSTPLPSVVCQCSSADPVGTNTGNWECELVIYLRESADDTTEDEHLAHAGAVFDLFLNWQDATTAMSLLADFTCEHLVAGRQSYEAVGRSWRSQMTVSVHCFGQDST